MLLNVRVAFGLEPLADLLHIARPAGTGELKRSFDQPHGDGHHWISRHLLIPLCEGRLGRCGQRPRIPTEVADGPIATGMTLPDLA